MQTTTEEYFVKTLEEVVNNIYQQLCGMGHHFNLANGEIDVPEIINNINTPFPQNFPCYVRIKCDYDVHIDIYIEVLHD